MSKEKNKFNIKSAIKILKNNDLMLAIWIIFILILGGPLNLGFKCDFNYVLKNIIFSLNLGNFYLSAAAISASNIFYFVYEFINENDILYKQSKTKILVISILIIVIAMGIKVQGVNYDLNIKYYMVNLNYKDALFQIAIYTSAIINSLYMLAIQFNERYI